MRLTVATPRLTLRPPEHADAPAIAGGVGDMAVARMTSAIPHPYPVEAAEGWIAMLAARRARRREFVFLLDMPDHGVAGCIGVFKRRLEDDWELGYWIARPHWGRGLATEAVEATLGWARAELGAARLLAGHFEDNPASRRVLEKAGFAPTGASCPEFSMARGERVRCIGMARTLAAVEPA